MIKYLLEQESRLKHIVITELSTEEDKIVKKIFKNSVAIERLKIINFTSDYSKYFQSCDLFIDSFPVSSALTHIELMKHKKVSVIKINDKNILYNFYKYFPQNYQYMFKDVKLMSAQILKLLNDPEKINETGNILYKHFLKKYEASEAVKPYLSVIENSNT